VALQFLEHPLTIDAVLLSMVQDVDLPERQQKLANDGVGHDDVP
jgi:hypothetical protein